MSGFDWSKNETRRRIERWGKAPIEVFGGATEPLEGRRKKHRKKVRTATARPLLENRSAG